MTYRRYKMKVKLIGIRGYNYTDKKTGEQKQGAVLRVCSAVPYEDNDYNGNFEYGCLIRLFRNIL